MYCWWQSTVVHQPNLKNFNTETFVMEFALVPLPHLLRLWDDETMPFCCTPLNSCGLYDKRYTPRYQHVQHFPIYLGIKLTQQQLYRFCNYTIINHVTVFHYATDNMIQTRKYPYGENKCCHLFNKAKCLEIQLT